MAKAPEAKSSPIRSQAELSGLSGWERSARLWSGLILFTFVLMHFLNHALGIFGIATLEYFQALAGRPVALHDRHYVALRRRHRASRFLS